MIKKQFIQNFKSGDSVDDLFVLSEKNMSQKRDGSNYYNVTLTDKTGSIKGVIWDHIEFVTDNINSGDFVHVGGHISEYRGAIQFIVKEIKPLSIGSVDPSDFLPATDRDIDKMYLRLLNITSSIENRFLKKLFEAFWNDAEFVSRFKNAPAAKKMHHAYIGGLLEHTLSMSILVDRIVGHYKGIDRDLLLAGVIFHDMGKIREFEYKTKIDYSDEGRLISHIVIGVQMLDEKINGIDGFPKDLATQLRHLIVSHHGTREFGSPEPPKTVEAVLLNYIDEIDSKINGIREFMASDDPNENWTPYHRLLGRHFFKGDINKS